MTEAFDYSSFTQIAVSLIAAAGMPCVWYKPSLPDPDLPQWRNKQSGPPDQFPVTLAFFSPIDISRGRGQYGIFEKGSDTPSYSEVALLAGGQAFEPAITDWVMRKGERLEIVALDKIAPAGDAVLWYVGIK